MGADNINSVIRRYSAMIDTSGKEPPRGIQMAAIMGGGVYTDSATAPTDGDTVLNGRLSLGILAAFILGAVGFYIWTHNIQGGG